MCSFHCRLKTVCIPVYLNEHNENDDICAVFGMRFLQDGGFPYRYSQNRYQANNACQIPVTHAKVISVNSGALFSLLKSFTLYFIFNS